MKMFLNILTRFIIPVIAIYLAFVLLGSLGGIIALILYFCYMNYSFLVQNMAASRYRKGDVGGSLKMLERALRLSPGNYKARGTYAFLLLKTGEIEEASKQIDKALTDCMGPRDKSPLKVTKSLVLWKQSEIDKAIELMEQVLNDFRNSNAYGTLGFLYIEKGDLDKALSFNLEAYDYNNTNAIIVDNLGYTRYLRNEYDEALSLYEQLMKLKPGFPVAFYNYARVLEHFEKLEDAAYMCRYALTLKFWSNSGVTREEIESKLSELEAAIKAKDEAKVLESGGGFEDSTDPGNAADISIGNEQ